MTKQLKNYINNNPLLDIKLYVTYILDISKTAEWTDDQIATIEKVKNHLKLKK